MVAPFSLADRGGRLSLRQQRCFRLNRRYASRGDRRGLRGSGVENLPGGRDLGPSAIAKFAMSAGLGLADIQGRGRPVDPPNETMFPGVIVRPCVGRAVAGEADLGQRVVSVGQHAERANVVWFHGGGTQTWSTADFIQSLAGPSKSPGACRSFVAAIIVWRRMSDDLPTPRPTLRSRYACVLVWCKAINADLQAIIEAGRGDVPLKDLKFRCAQSAAG
jgi:hypothetical protein